MHNALQTEIIRANEQQLVRQSTRTRFLRRPAPRFSRLRRFRDAAPASRR